MTLYLRPLLDELKIKTTSLQLRKFDLDYIDPDPTIGDWGWAQRPYIKEIERQYNSGKPVRIIVLKARQLGISTATEAVLFLWAFLHPGSNELILSHQDGQAQELYEMTRTYWDNWPHKILFDERYKTRRQLRWTDTGSQIRVATAKNPEGLRGSTIQALHGSEVAFWQDAETLWTGLNNTIPRRHGTIAVLESTANGVGNWFHEKWEEAEAGENEFTPMFFPWFYHPAYRLHNTLSTTDLDTDEREILRIMNRGDESVHRPLTISESMASLAWRRLEIPRQGGVEHFHQEFPSTPHEAFVTSGHPIFNPSRIEDCFNGKSGAMGRLYKDGRGRVVFEDDPSGNLRVFRKPSTVDVRPDKYFVAGDPSETTVGDYGCIQVLNRSTLEQVAIWRGRINPISFAREMMYLGEFYHFAMLCPEVEGGGQATIGAILQAQYPSVWNWKKEDRNNTSINTYGWSTNYNTKMAAISRLQNVFNTRSITIHDRTTKSELLNYVELPNGNLGNTGGSSAHDDTVMALAICVAASQMQGMFRNTSQPSPDIYASEFESGQTSLDSIENIIPIRKIRG